MRRTGAFSLIELLVVLAIVAVLAGLLLPAIGMAKATANAAVCGGRQRQLAAGILAYAQESEGILPCGTMLPPSGSSLTSAAYEAYYWAHPVGDLVDAPWTYNDPLHQPRIFACPAQTAFLSPGFRVSYVMTYYASHPEIAHAYVGYTWAPLSRYTTSGNALLGEVRSDERGWNSAGIYDFKRLDFPDLAVDSGWPAAFARHRTGFNAAFPDGRVQRIAAADYYSAFIVARRGF